MAKPRVFISSTFYDLKYIRASLDEFVRNLGFEPVLSEKGDIAYAFDRPLDESCYREVGNCDIFVAVIGGRYGSPRSGTEETATAPEFYARYSSVTRGEIDEAIRLDIPIYVLIDKPVHAEFRTYKLNKGNEEMVYAHAESVNVFELIEQIVSLPRNNPIQTFDNFDDIGPWLREQWAGQFRNLLKRQVDSEKIRDLATQVAELSDINATLKSYLETLMEHQLTPENSSEVIANEDRRLERNRNLHRLMAEPSVSFTLGHLVRSGSNVGSEMEIAEVFIEAVESSRTGMELFDKLDAEFGVENITFLRDFALSAESAYGHDLNTIRAILGLSPFADISEPDGGATPV